MDFEKRGLFSVNVLSKVSRSGWICFSNDARVASHLDTGRLNPNLMNWELSVYCWQCWMLCCCQLMSIVHGLSICVCNRWHKFSLIFLKFSLSHSWTYFVFKILRSRTCNGLSKDVWWCLVSNLIPKIRFYNVSLHLVSDYLPLSLNH